MVFQIRTQILYSHFFKRNGLFLRCFIYYEVTVSDKVSLWSDVTHSYAVFLWSEGRSFHYGTELKFQSKWLNFYKL